MPRAKEAKGARAIWDGTLRFAGVSLPVKLYAAVQDRGVHFHLLHDKDKERLKQRMVDPESGEEVPPGKALRGVEVEAGVFVLLDPDEIPEAPSDDAREIEITRFVDAGRIEEAWYERPYYLGPRASASKYLALAQALERTGKKGIARWTMRKKRYVGALHAAGGHLVLITLRHAGEVIAASELPSPPGRAPTKAEGAMAEQLVSMLEGEFDPTQFKDEYRDRVLELIRAKARGKMLRFERPKRQARPADLEDALAASLRRMKGKGHARTTARG